MTVKQDGKVAHDTKDLEVFMGCLPGVQMRSVCLVLPSSGQRKLPECLASQSCGADKEGASEQKGHLSGCTASLSAARHLFPP